MLHRPMSRKLGALALLIAVLFALRTAWEFFDLSFPGYGSTAYAQNNSAEEPPARLTQQDGRCVFTGTGDKGTEPFEITSGNWRVSYEYPNVGQGTQLSLTVAVFDENDERIRADREPSGSGKTGEDASTSGTFVVNSTPGVYYLEVVPENDQREWRVSVDPCAGSASGSGGTTTPRPAPEPTQKASEPPPERTLEAPKTTQSQQSNQQPGSLMKAGGPAVGPFPLMPDGSCPKEYPVKRNGACYVSDR